MKKYEIKLGLEQIIEDRNRDNSTFPEDQLMQALYWIWDAFDRCLMGMFLVYGTATIAIDNKWMKGDKITVGTRINEWNAGSKNILLAFTGDPIITTEKYVVFKNPFNEVLVYVYIFPEDVCIINTQDLLYGNEFFKIPNPYNRFEKVFGTYNE